ncbi:MAG TPA: glucosyl-3-phosphoglycerate synthase [Acidimicrobiales bacterium]|nr:glucosyl-3-phosphoglycerate synthase [Acidimicrobiales bacterium]
MLQPVVSVVIPARNEAATVGAIVRAVRGLGGAVGEVLIVDDGSTDDTAAVAACAGASVVEAAAVLPRFGTGPGKGQAMWKGLAESGGDVVVFCDADLRHFDPSFVTRLADALVAHPGAAIAKGRYSARAGSGGRVNELVARPALELLHPLLAGLAQPLGGEYAMWRDVAEQVPFVHGYGVDLGLVLDIAERFGAGAIVEADLGIRTHRNRSLDELRPQARVVLEVALQRAGMLASALPECPPLRSVAGYERRTA